MQILHATILGVIEGITEFLPISSTGHMVIASSIMNIGNDEFTKIFEVNIQFGAILSVLVLYWKRFITSIDFYYKLFIAFLPVAIIGLLFNKVIDRLLGNPLVVAFSLLIGGIILIFIDKIFENAKDEIETIDYKKALIIGFFQCIAIIPGVSRSASTIIGGQTQGLNRKAAAEFSFFLAVPTMFAASAYKLLKGYKIIQRDDITALLVGNVVAFVVALIAIKYFIEFLSKHGFKMFGYYRIVLGLLLIILSFSGIDLKI
ncbi:MAG: undecaprenyl-diphosphate phosphatase [Candidatus Sericytochromatia bacterium]|nr:undecaprenyl-diphosphate phosphatase [Candidatus Sericytochromatia bacterium]